MREFASSRKKDTPVVHPKSGGTLGGSQPLENASDDDQEI